MSIQEEIIEEAALICLHEQDGMPCLLRRARLRQMIEEYIHGSVPPWACAEPAHIDADGRGWRKTRGKLAAANDDTWSD